jgi:hypothetical protein
MRFGVYLYRVGGGVCSEVQGVLLTEGVYTRKYVVYRTPRGCVGDVRMFGVFFGVRV